MGFCKNIGRTLYKAMHDVDERVLSVADEVILITGRIKALNDNPILADIEEALGIGSPVHNWIDNALFKIFKIALTGKTLAEKFKQLLDEQPTELAKNGSLLKIASVATSLGDGRGLHESTYDQAATIAIARAKILD